MYQVIARVIRVRDGWTSSVGVPTFYLADSVQGLTCGAHAASFAARMLQELAPDARIVGSVCNEQGEDYATF